VDGRVTGVVGTHTHIQTADERVLSGGTAYITDMGMTGPLDSVLGVDKNIIIEKFLKQLPIRFEVADGPVLLCGVLIKAEEGTGKAVSIQRVQEKFSQT
jgi:2',3'-cyclic-nucleotide 2'-phosphodiesterase